MGKGPTPDLSLEDVDEGWCMVSPIEDLQGDFDRIPNRKVEEDLAEKKHDEELFRQPSVLGRQLGDAKASNGSIPQLMQKPIGLQLFGVTPSFMECSIGTILTQQDMENLAKTISNTTANAAVNSNNGKKKKGGKKGKKGKRRRR